MNDPPRTFCPLDSTLDLTELSQDELFTEDLDEVNVDKLVVGIPEEYLCEDMSDEVVQAWSDAAECLAGLGGANIEVLNKEKKDTYVISYIQRFLFFSILVAADQTGQPASHKVRPVLLLGSQSV